MAAITTKSRHPRKGARFNPTPGRVRYSPGWLGAAAGGALFSVAAVASGGPGAAAAIGAAGLATAAYATLVEPRRPRLERVTMRFADLPAGLDGLRIGQLSDLHLGMRYTAENARWAAEQMAAERPDLLAFTGDFVSYEHAIGDLPAVLAPLAELRPPLGAYAVPGNHDYWEGVPEIRRVLEPFGIEFLINAHRVVRHNGVAFTLAGLDDLWDGVPDLDGALRDAPAGAFTLLLAHCPDTADEAAARGVNAQLSGHTHGGHMILPLIGSFCLPRFGWRHPVGHRHVDKLQLYVSRGAGGLPLRLNCPPEATVITLRQG